MNAAPGDRIETPKHPPGGPGAPLFEPLRPATPAVRTALLLSGPLLWVAGLIVLAVVIDRANLVGIALLILAVAFLVSVAFLIPSRRRAIREIQEP